jgi:hypothetical protein
MVTWFLLVSRMSRHQHSRAHGQIMSFLMSQRMIGPPMNTGSGPHKRYVHRRRPPRNTGATLKAPPEQSRAAIAKAL